MTILTIRNRCFSGFYLCPVKKFEVVAVFDASGRFDTLVGWLIAISILSVIAPGTARGEGYSLNGSVAIGSDLTFRGVSQTMGDLAVENTHVGDLFTELAGVSG